MQTSKILVVLVLVLSMASLSAQAQSTKKYNLADLLKDNKLTPCNRTPSLLENQTHKGIKLDERDDEGVVWLKDVRFSAGTIELDVRGKDILQKSFIGIAFHAVNDSTFDGIYFRPFNFQAKDSVRKIHAVQYISHPQFTWGKLRQERNGIFEKGLVSPPDPNGWFHVRIEVKGHAVTVFVNDDKTPSLTVTKLNDRKDGKIGIWVGDGSDGEFANLTIVNR